MPFYNKNKESRIIMNKNNVVLDIYNKDDVVLQQIIPAPVYNTYENITQYNSTSFVAHINADSVWVESDANVLPLYKWKENSIIKGLWVVFNNGTQTSKIDIDNLQYETAYSGMVTQTASLSNLDIKFVDENIIAIRITSGDDNYNVKQLKIDIYEQYV